jgi:hypothetical protein
MIKKHTFIRTTQNIGGSKALTEMSTSSKSHRRFDDGFDM